MNSHLHSNPYLNSLFATGAFPIRKANITNLNNPHNPAPSSYIIPPNEYFSVSSSRRKQHRPTQGHATLDKDALIAAALTPQNRKEEGRSQRNTARPPSQTPDGTLPSRRKRRRQAEDSPLFEPSDHDASSSDGGACSISSQPFQATSGRRRGRRNRRPADLADAYDEEDEEVEGKAGDAHGAPPTPKADPSSRVTPKRRSKKPKTVAKATPKYLRRKSESTPVPRSLQEAGDADKMMWKLKHEGANWEAIRQKWEEITGHLPGKSTLSVRYIKLSRNIAENGGEDDLALLRYKADIETEMQAELWKRISSKIQEQNGKKYLPHVLRNRYAQLEEGQFQTAKQHHEDENHREICPTPPNEGFDMAGNPLAQAAEVNYAFIDHGMQPHFAHYDNAELGTADDLQSHVSYNFQQEMHDESKDPKSEDYFTRQPQPLRTPQSQSPGLMLPSGAVSSNDIVSPAARLGLTGYSSTESEAEAEGDLEDDYAV